MNKYLKLKRKIPTFSPNYCLINYFDRKLPLFQFYKTFIKQFSKGIKAPAGFKKHQKVIEKEMINKSYENLSLHDIQAKHEKKVQVLFK